MTIYVQEPVSCLANMGVGQWAIAVRSFSCIEKGSLVLRINVDETRSNAKKIEAEWLVVDSGRADATRIEHAGFVAPIMREPFLRVLPPGTILSITVLDKDD